MPTFENDPAPKTRYLQAVRWSIAHRWIAFGMATLAFVFSVGLARALSFEFIPAGDEGVTTIAIELPPGAKLSDTETVVRRVTTILRSRSEVKSVYASIGSSSQSSGPGGGGSLADVRRARVYANLIDKRDRELGQQAFEREMAGVMAEIPGARLSFGSNEGGQSSGISVTLVGDDGETLSRAARAVETQMRGIPGFENVINTADIARPEILVTPKPDQAARMGVSAAVISQAVRVATIGDVDQALAKYNVGDRQIPIRIRLNDDAREDLAVLANLQVPTSSGVPVPLSAVADITLGAGPSQISRLDRSRNATIKAELNGLALGAANTKLHELPAMKTLPAGVTEQVSGIVERLMELVTGFGIALLTGILLMYVVLVLLFKSFIHPVTIQAALPLAIGGAFGLLLLTGRNLSMPALIGILMLMGIAAKNSILLVEYAIEAKAKRGLTTREAIMDACHKRARPILMTTVAMGAGMLPVAMGFGEDTEFRSPMAIAVIGGLISSTLLSLLFVPVIFTIVDDLWHWGQSRLDKRFAGQKQAPVAH